MQGEGGRERERESYIERIEEEERIPLVKK
jgi:hypothetical protein